MERTFSEAGRSSANGQVNKMNLSELFSSFDFHDSYIEIFDIDVYERRITCCLNLGDWQKKERCTIEFSDIVMFHIETNNSDFIGNELIDFTVSSNADGSERFRGYFHEGLGKPGKVIELLCKKLRIVLE